MRLPRQLGGDAKMYMKEQDGKHIVTEVHSPPRVTACAKLLCPASASCPGLAFDFTTVEERGVAVWRV